MFGKKMAAAALMILAATLMAQPAMAGVGGCGKLVGVGGCGSGQLTSNAPGGGVPVWLDTLQGAVRADYIAAIKALIDSGKKGGAIEQGGTQTSDGVGGCSPWIGVGGCKL